MILKSWLGSLMRLQSTVYQVAGLTGLTQSEGQLIEY